MNKMDLFENLTQTEIACFQRICRKLLKSTFIVKEKNEEHRKDYVFVKNHTDVFSEYFKMIGYDVICDTNSCVVRLINLASAGEEGRIQSNRKRFKLAESIVLCALWLKYEEMLVNGGLTQAVIIQKSDLDFQLEKMGAKNKIDKKVMIGILDQLEAFNLIEVIGQVGEPDCRIRLYTSMQFCLSEQSFKQMAETSAENMQLKNDADVKVTGINYSEDGEEDE